MTEPEKKTSDRRVLGEITSRTGIVILSVVIVLVAGRIVLSCDVDPHIVRGSQNQVER